MVPCINRFQSSTTSLQKMASGSLTESDSPKSNLSDTKSHKRRLFANLSPTLQPSFMMQPNARLYLNKSLFTLSSFFNEASTSQSSAMSVCKSLTSLISRIRKTLTPYVKILKKPTNPSNSNTPMQHNNRQRSALPGYLSITCSMATSILTAVGFETISLAVFSTQLTSIPNWFSRYLRSSAICFQRVFQSLGRTSKISLSQIWIRTSRIHFNGYRSMLRRRWFVPAPMSSIVGQDQIALTHLPGVVYCYIQGGKVSSMHNSV